MGIGWPVAGVALGVARAGWGMEDVGRAVAGVDCGVARADGIVGEGWGLACPG